MAATVPPLPPDLIPEDELATRALAQCRAHATAEIPGPLTIEPLTRATAFDEQQLRFVFEQVLLVWRRMGDFEVILDEDDASIGFVDGGEQAAAVWADISPDDVLRLAIESGWVSEAAARLGPLVRVAGGTCAASSAVSSCASAVLVNPRTNKAFAMSKRWRTVDTRSTLR